MVALITDRYLKRRLIRRRRAWGADRYDEVWNGVYVINALPDNEHQGLSARISYVLQTVVADPGDGIVFLGCNVSDRATRWRRNYRVPDVAVFLNVTKAIDKKSHWLGGPDLAIEIVSPRDRSRKKLDFYATVGTRELLLIDRKPWSLELYRLADQEMELAGRAAVDSPDKLTTSTVNLTWQLHSGAERPVIEVSTPDGSQCWQA